MDEALGFVVILLFAGFLMLVGGCIGSDSTKEVMQKQAVAHGVAEFVQVSGNVEFKWKELK